MEIGSYEDIADERTGDDIRKFQPGRRRWLTGASNKNRVVARMRTCNKYVRVEIKEQINNLLMLHVGPRTRATRIP